MKNTKRKKNGTSVIVPIEICRSERDEVTFNVRLPNHHGTPDFDIRAANLRSAVDTFLDYLDCELDHAEDITDGEVPDWTPDEEDEEEERT